MSTWEQRMAARAKRRREHREAVEHALFERAYAEQEAAFRASLPPCPCRLDPCPAPPDPREWLWVWRWHRDAWERFNEAGRCPWCDQPMDRPAFASHECPDAPVIAIG